METSGATTPFKETRSPFQVNNSLYKLGCCSFHSTFTIQLSDFFSPGENIPAIICTFLVLFDTYYQMSNQNDCLNLHMEENVHYPSPFTSFAIH